MRFNEREIHEARRVLEKYLKMAEEELDVKINLGNIKYNEASFRTSLEVNARTESGEVMVNPKHERNAYWAIKEKLPNYTGKVIGSQAYVFNLGRVIIKDFNTRAKRYPFIVEDENGKQYRTSVRTIESIG